MLIVDKLMNANCLINLPRQPPVDSLGVSATPSSLPKQDFCSSFFLECMFPVSHIYLCLSALNDSHPGS